MLKLVNKGACEFPKKMNLGCGKKMLTDCINIDTGFNDMIDEECWVFDGIITCPQDLPSCWFEYIFTEMVMEHVHPDHIPNLLYCLQNMTAPGGRLVIIVPNFLELAKELVEANFDDDLDILDLKRIREINNEMLMPYMGDKPGMSHQSIWTPKMARYWLGNEGWKIIKIEEFGKNKFYLRIEAIKPKGNPYASAIE